jgi:hypothetical protein
VQHRARQIEDAALRWLHQGFEPRAAPLGDFGIGRAGIGGAQLIQDVAHGGYRELAAIVIRQRHNRGRAQEVIDGGKRGAGIDGRRFRHHVTEIRMLLRGARGTAF